MGGVLKRAQHSGHITQGGAFDAPFRDRTGGFALEINDDEIVSREEHLSEMEIAVAADAHGADFAFEQIFEAVYQVFFVFHDENHQRAKVFGQAVESEMKSGRPNLSPILTMMGWSAYRAGDYVVIPRGVLHRWRLATGPHRLLVIESAGYVRTPKRYRNEHGQLLETSPFSERDIRRPELLQPRDETGRFVTMVKKGHALTEVTLDHHPCDVVGWVDEEEQREGDVEFWGGHAAAFAGGEGKVRQTEKGCGDWGVISAARRFSPPSAWMYKRSAGTGAPSTSKRKPVTVAGANELFKAKEKPPE